MSFDPLETITTAGTESEQAHIDLSNAYLASELGMNTSRILAVLNEEQNQEPNKLIGTYIAENPQTYVWVEPDKYYIRAHILDRNNEEAGCMDMSINPKNILCETVSQATCDKLTGLAIIKEEAQARVDAKVEHAI